MTALTIPASLTVVRAMHAPAEAAALNAPAMLSVIRNMETGDQWHHIGGAYQFKWSTWADYTTEPYYMAKLPRVADAIAARHLAWIVAQLTAHRCPVDPGRVYLVWRHGLSGFLNGAGDNAVGRDMAVRAGNLYGEFNR